MINSRFSLERRRLTLAHELAHRLIDPQSLEDKEEEKAANLFAGAFLMPGNIFFGRLAKSGMHLAMKS